MSILVGSDVPGLLSALERALGSAQPFVVARDAEGVFSILRDSEFRLDALVINDGILPLPGKDIATSLWELTSYASRYREPVAPVIMTLSRDTPLLVQDALRAEVAKTGGALHIVSHRARTYDHPEAREAVAWIMSQLALEPQRRQYTIVSTNNAGGSGKTSTVMNFCLQLSPFGLRVLVVDFDIAQGALLSWFRAEAEALEFYTTLPDEYRNLDGTFPLEMVERRVFHHSSGLDILFSGNGVRDQLDLSPASLEALVYTTALMDYDVVCFDMPGEWKARPVIVSLLAQRTASPFVVCPPGRKERDGALAALEVLGKIERADGRTALDTAMLLFIEGERGQVMNIRSVRQELLRHYPMVTDLGTLPRDPALLSMARERHEFCSVFDLAPRRPYCHAIRSAVRRWVEVVEMPATWLSRADPDEKRPAFWRRSRSRISGHTSTPQHATSIRGEQQQ
jgi:MinD-like ATPase involved in chromosome partitioning or flagellar assembly